MYIKNSLPKNTEYVKGHTISCHTIMARKRNKSSGEGVTFLNTSLFQLENFKYRNLIPDQGTFGSLSLQNLQKYRKLYWNIILTYYPTPQIKFHHMNLMNILAVLYHTLYITNKAFINQNIYFIKQILFLSIDGNK